MSALYQVHRHPALGQWGFSGIEDGQILTAFIDPRDQQLTRGAIAPLQLAAALARLQRAGFQRAAQAHYLQQAGPDLQTGRFVLRHPELGADLAGELVLFAVCTDALDMTEVAAQWEAALADADSPDHRARAAWLAHCARARTYVPAMSHDAHGVLLVAQWARDHALVLLPSKGSIPAEAPHRGRDDWHAFLQPWFAPAAINTAMTQLGWSSEVVAPAVLPAVATDISTLPAGEDRWLDLARRAAF